jgi:hypothetical protein
MMENFLFLINKNEYIIYIYYTYTHIMKKNYFDDKFCKKCGEYMIHMVNNEDKKKLIQLYCNNCKIFNKIENDNFIYYTDKKDLSLLPENVNDTILSMLIDTSLYPSIEITDPIPSHKNCKNKIFKYTVDEKFKRTYLCKKCLKYWK